MIFLSKTLDYGLMYLLYSLALLFLTLAFLPVFLFQAIWTGKYRRGLGERLSLYGRKPTRFDKGRPIWIHAVSVGEVMAASPLASLLRAKHPDVPILVSTVTETGNRVARDQIPGVERVIFFPFDWRWIVDRALERFNPRLVLLTETEIWPNFLRACYLRRIPVAIINGRLSRRSFRNYRIVKPWLRQVMAQIDLLCVQTEEDARRFIELGAPGEKVRVTGNIKFDFQDRVNIGSELLESWIPADAPVFIAGSIHRGEEEAILQVFLKAVPEFPGLVLILAPRHPERISEVETLLQRMGIPYSRRTEILKSEKRPTRVILLDTIGELASLYRLGTLIFIGGSLVPRGGHNILEPAFYGKPILFGPHMENFQEIASLFLSQGAALQVMNKEELGEKVMSILRSPEKVAALGSAAYEVMAAHRGAALRTLALIEEYL